MKILNPHVRLIIALARAEAGGARKWEARVGRGKGAGTGWEAGLAGERRDPSAGRKRYPSCWRSPRLLVGCPRLLQSLHSPNPGRPCRFRAVLSLSFPAAHPRLLVRRSAPGSGHGHTEGPSRSPSQGEQCGFEWGGEALERRGSERTRALGSSVPSPPHLSRSFCSLVCCQKHLIPRE